MNESKIICPHCHTGMPLSEALPEIRNPALPAA